MKYHQTTKRLTVLASVTLSILIGYSGEVTAETTDKVISAVLLEQSLPTPVEVGKPFDCEIKVTNQTSRTVEEVVVTDKLSPVFKFISAVPEPQDVLSIVWTLPEIAFDSDSHEIKSEYRQSLEQAAQAIAANPDAQFTIEGHTDNVGEASYNLELSRKRADTVKTYLVNEFSMNASQISAIGFGEEQPLVDNDSENNRQKNRRVEIRLGEQQIQSDVIGQAGIGTCCEK
jgi:outer membrane protein OmpA-like peptidoglycan-associated protein